jgi:SAM-dependent methyltransferase
MSNECVEAVVCGLGPKVDETIVSICNNGEVPLALLEYSDRVIALDNDDKELKYTFEMIAHLINGRYDHFLDELLISENREYFSANGRLDCIRERIDLLQILKGDIFRDLPDNFAKVYLSNALTYAGGSTVGVTEGLSLIAQSLPPNGLAYISDGHKVFPPYLVSHEISPQLCVCEDLTIRAREKESFWSPVVFQNIRPTRKRRNNWRIISI